MLAEGGSGGNFNGTMPVTHPWLGGVSGQYWMKWQDTEAMLWIIYISCYGYHIPFHHLPPMTWEPRKFLSYCLGPVKAQALKDKVDRLLLKGTLSAFQDKTSDNLLVSITSSLLMMMYVNKHEAQHLYPSVSIT